MKSVLKLYAAALLLFASCAPLSADTISAGTGDKSNAGPWWTIPYPGRFDPAQLTKEQPSISVVGNGFVDSNGKSFVFRGVNIADPGKLAFQDKWNIGPKPGELYGNPGNLMDRVVF